MLAEKEVERYVKATKELSDKLVELTGDKELNNLFKEQTSAFIGVINAYHNNTYSIAEYLRKGINKRLKELQDAFYGSLFH